MDGYDGYVSPIGAYVDFSLFEEPVFPYEMSVEQVETLTIYFMRAKDNNSITTTYRSWESRDAPDLTASKYSGPYDGISLSFSDIIVTYQITYT